MSEDTSREQAVQISVALEHEGRSMQQAGHGNGPIDAFVAALGLDIRVMDYHEHAIGAGANAQAASYVELRVGDGPTTFGVGVDGNIATASFKAVISAVNRHLSTGKA
jgi:2-isopropylmalate synthase